MKYLGATIDVLWRETRGGKVSWIVNNTYSTGTQQYVTGDSIKSAIFWAKEAVQYYNENERKIRKALKERK